MIASKEYTLEDKASLSSLGETILTTYIEKGRDSMFSQDENRKDGNQGDQVQETQSNYPSFFNMLNTDVSECDEKWIERFNQAIINATDDEIKSYAKPTIEMLSSIIYFLLTEKDCEKNEDDKKIYDTQDKKNESNSDLFTVHYNINDNYESDELLKNLTDGLDPKYIDPDVNMIQTTKVKDCNFDEYSISNEGKKLYKTHQDIL